MLQFRTCLPALVLSLLSTGIVHADVVAPLNATTAAAAALDATLQAQADRGPEFAQGTWTFQVYGSGAIGVDEGNVYRAHAGIGYYLLDDLSINFEGTGAYIDSDDPDGGRSAFTTGGAGFSILLRWHFFKSDDSRFTVYLEGGSGILYTAQDFPVGTNDINFASEVGLGLTYELTPGTRLMTGVRYMHISNAGLADSNRGYDAVVLYAGLMCRF